MSSLSTLPKGDSAWLLRKSIQRVMQQVSVLETNIGSSTTGNSANTQIIFNDAGTLRGDAQFTWNKTLNRLTVDGDETISGDLTVATSVLKVDTINDRVGIGTASPATILDIQSAGGLFARIQNTTSTADAYLLVKNTTGEGFFGINALGPYIYTASALPIVFTTATFERYRIAGDGVATWSNVGGVAGTAMTLNSSGLGVGVVPSYKLDVAGIVRIGGGVNPSMRLETGTNTGFIDYNNTRLALHAGSLPIDFVAGNTTKMTLTASGDLLVGKTASLFSTVGFEASQTGFLSVTNSASTNASTNLSLYSTGAAAFRFYVGLAGTVFATNTTISAISDARLKENVQDIDVGLGAILALKPRKFDWKAGKGKDIKGDRGFIAQEFETVFPNLIDEWKDNAPEGEAPYKSVRQDLIPVLVKAIQELTARVEALEA